MPCCLSTTLLNNFFFFFSCILWQLVPHFRAHYRHLRPVVLSHPSLAVPPETTRGRHCRVHLSPAPGPAPSFLGTVTLSSVTRLWQEKGLVKWRSGRQSTFSSECFCVLRGVFSVRSCALRKGCGVCVLVSISLLLAQRLVVLVSFLHLHYITIFFIFTSMCKPVFDSFVPLLCFDGWLPNLLGWFWRREHYINTLHPHSVILLFSALLPIILLF